MFTVQSALSDTHGETNYVWMNTKCEYNFVLIYNYIFSVKTDDSVSADCIALNLIMRQMFNVRVADKIKIMNIDPIESFIVETNLVIGRVRSNKVISNIDYYRCITEFINKFKDQHFSNGQKILFVHEMQKYVIEINNPQIFSNTENIQYYGKIDENTKILLQSNNEDITISNIPDELMDDAHKKKELFNINPYDLEKMGIGGLTEEFITLFRRAFITRLLPPSYLKKLKTKHVKGVLLHGPPGTGKTLIARKIGEMLNCKPPKIVNGPEILNKYVGGSEQNIRALFNEAEIEQNEKGDKSDLHLIIFDEFDSLCKKRGMTNDNTGVSDNIVNQLLSKIDGVNSLNNVLLIGMTNRKDLIDDAILRPGRFEVHIQITLPDLPGRIEILKIHTHNVRENNILDENVNLEILANQAKNFSGAELEGLVKSAETYALQRHINKDNPGQLENIDTIRIYHQDFMSALNDIKPAFGNDANVIFDNLSGDIIEYGDLWSDIDFSIKKYIKNFSENQLLSTFRVLLHGDSGCGKTTISNYISKLINYPYVKVISPSLFIGCSDIMKINMIKKIFLDAYQSNNSVIIIDDIERLIEYSEYGCRYSNNVLQTLLVLIGQNTKRKNKLFIIGTCKNIQIMNKLELYETFDEDLYISNIDNDSVRFICDYYGKQQIQLKNDIPIKKLITKLIVE
jgi:vesicle-fusing ATPase